MKSKLESNHEFGAWRVSNDSPCIDQRQCKKCGHLELKEQYIRHLWSFWAQNSILCIERRKCESCEQVEERKIPHEWSVIATSQCAELRKCKNCDKSENRSLHKWMDIRNGRTGYQKCKICGKRQGYYELDVPSLL